MHRISTICENTPPIFPWVKMHNQFLKDEWDLCMGSNCCSNWLKSPERAVNQSKNNLGYNFNWFLTIHPLSNFSF
jgi:hypothetical protein